jgi:hypothetical protein
LSELWQTPGAASATRNATQKSKDRNIVFVSSWRG